MKNEIEELICESLGIVFDNQIIGYTILDSTNGSTIQFTIHTSVMVIMVSEKCTISTIEHYGDWLRISGTITRK